MAAVLAGSLAALMAPTLKADPVKKRTEIIFAEPTEIPDMVLLAGPYVIKVPDPVTHSDMVGFYDLNESHLYKLVRTIPAYRLDVTDQTVITFEERTHGAPAAIKTWFYPDENWGREFVYPKAKTLTVAEAVPPPPPAPAPLAVAAEPQPVAPAPLAVAAEPQPEATAPVEIAQVTAPPATAPAPAPVPEAPAPLPATASPYFLLAAAGILSTAAGLGLKQGAARMRG